MDYKVILTREMLYKKHFSPTAALILQRKHFDDTKIRAGFVGGILQSLVFSKIRAGLTQPFISTNEMASTKKKGLPKSKKCIFKCIFWVNLI